MEEQTKEPTDIFLWANQTDGTKNELDIEVFLFNKLYTPYSIRTSKALEQQIRALFLYDVINDVNLGAGLGLAVRDYELSEAEDNVLLRTESEKVERVTNLRYMIEKKRGEIEEFNEEDHEFKRMKGIVVKFSSKESGKKPFYVAKAIAQSNVLKGSISWQINGGQIEPFAADVGLKIPGDNQVLIVDEDIFIFNQRKFETLFQYEFKQQLLTDAKVKEIEARYKLSFPDGLDLQMLVRDKKKIVNKIQKIEIGAISQEKAIEYADDMALELMTDEAGAIIIMDGSDLDTFVNLINEDYITSEITGKRYEIKSKKLLDNEPAGEPPRGL